MIKQVGRVQHLLPIAAEDDTGKFTLNLRQLFDFKFHLFLIARTPIILIGLGSGVLILETVQGSVNLIVEPLTALTLKDKLRHRVLLVEKLRLEALGYVHADPVLIGPVALMIWDCLIDLIQIIFDVFVSGDPFTREAARRVVVVSDLQLVAVIFELVQLTTIIW